MYQEKGLVYVESGDQCDTCSHFNSNPNCPLIEALAGGVVHLADTGTTVTNCGLYRRFRKPKLQAVKE